MVSEIQDLKSEVNNLKLSSFSGVLELKDTKSFGGNTWQTWTIGSAEEPLVV
jgi:hypothetical protein